SVQISMDCPPSTLIDCATATAAAARLDLPAFALTSSSWYSRMPRVALRRRHEQARELVRLAHHRVVPRVHLRVRGLESLGGAALMRLGRVARLATADHRRLPRALPEIAGRHGRLQRVDGMRRVPRETHARVAGSRAAKMRSSASARVRAARIC